MSKTARPTDAFHAVNRYLGWGDPAGGVWFVGIEEASGWEGSKNKQEVIDCYQNRCPFEEVKEMTDWSKNGHKGKQIRDFTCKIIAPLSDLGRQISWEEYRNQYLWVKGTKVFQANLFPIGKPKQAQWNDRFKTLFGFGSGEQNEYHKLVRNLRYPLIRDLKALYKPLAIVCFGKTCWAEHQQLFHLNGGGEKIFDGKILVYDNERIILAPFFGNGQMSDEMAKAIKDVLLGWSVKLP